MVAADAPKSRLLRLPNAAFVRHRNQSTGPCMVDCAMGMLILGLVLFLGIHVFTTLRGARAAAIGRLGDGPYKGLYSLVAAVGLVLIVWGFSRYRSAGY